MNHHIEPHKAGLTLGAFLGGFHCIWSILVAMGLAQAILDFIFRIHMIVPVYQVAAFNVTMAITLIIVTAIIGYVVGYAYAIFWNRLHR